MFPKVTKVVSDSKHFLSGNVLVEAFGDSAYRLKNTFCKMNGGNIDLKKVNRINDNALRTAGLPISQMLKKWYDVIIKRFPTITA